MEVHGPDSRASDQWTKNSTFYNHLSLYWSNICRSMVKTRIFLILLVCSLGGSLFFFPSFLGVVFNEASLLGCIHHPFLFLIVVESQILVEIIVCFRSWTCLIYQLSYCICSNTMWYDSVLVSILKYGGPW